jgi:hypothetical protein
MYDTSYGFVEIMNVNRGGFGSVMWINVTCIETVDNAAVFTILIYQQLYGCSGKEVYKCAVLINIVF